MNTMYTASISAISAAALLSSFAAAQTPQWLPSPGRAFAGPYGSVLATVEWDSDGAGPLPTSLVAAGTFTFAGNAPASNIALWNGTDWQPMGAGLNGQVNAVCVYNGEVYAGGLFSTSGGAPVSRIAKWNGTTWSDVGGGVTGGSAPSVTALIEFEGSLIAAGAFTSAGTTPVQNIAAWNGLAWSAYGALTGNLKTLANSNGQLFAMLASNNGVWVRDAMGTWQATAANDSYPATAMGGGEGTLILERNAQGAGNNWSYWQTWTGSGWASQPWTGGAIITSLKSLNATVYAGVAANVLHAYQGGVTTRSGNSWNNMPYTALGSVWTLGEYQGNLIAGGEIRQMVNTPLSGIAMKTPAGWQQLGHGLGASPIATGWANGSVYAATQALVNNAHFMTIQRLGENGWENLVTPAVNGSCTGFFDYHGAVYIAGSLSPQGSAAVSALSRLDGNQLVPIAGAPGAGVGTVYQDEVVIGSNPGVRAWNGAKWRTLASNANITQVEVVGDNLVVAGTFGSIDGVAATNIAYFDGNLWHAFAPAGPVAVDSLSQFQGAPAFSGKMTSSGHRGIWVWTNSAWNMIADTGSSTIPALELFDNSLYAGGSFTTIGGVAARAVARWDGTTWSPLGPGLTGGVQAMSSNGQALAIVGGMTQLGSEAAANFALWGFPPPPPCIGDFNHDGGVDGADVGAFFNAWSNGNPSADLNQDGGVDGGDVQTFFGAWEAGC